MSEDAQLLDLPAIPPHALFLRFKDGHSLTVTDEAVKAFTDSLLADVDRIPPAMKAATDFANCPICPLRDAGVFCHALQPVLPFVELIDRYYSFDPVLAVYRPSEEPLLLVAHTNMQTALQTLSLLSLLTYCEVGTPYRHYFQGTHPLLPPQQVARQVCLNVLWEKGGDRVLARAELNRITADLRATSTCQIKRLQLICQKDAVVNAFAETWFVTLRSAQELSRLPIRQDA